MAIVVRITSADGKKMIMKTFPGLPSRLKVPHGASVQVIEDGNTKSLSQYVNDHANKGSGEHRNGGKVAVDEADSWETAEAWLNSFEGVTPAKSDPAWFTTGSEGGDGRIVGLQKDALLIGGVAAVGIGAGVHFLSRDGGPKDTSAPSAPNTLDLETDDDTGTSTTDNITNKTAGITITGKAEAGATVELFNGTTSLGTTTATAEGTFTKDVSLESGEHSITAKATDKAGNASAASTAIKVTVDTTAPDVATVLNLANEDDTGASNTDNVTTKTSGLTINGLAEVGAKVELFDGTTSLGTATVGTSGIFALDISLADGTHSITAKVTDVAGNTSNASDPLVITVDTSVIPAAPTLLDLAAEDDNGTSSTDNITSLKSGLTISGHAVANTTVELFDGTTSLGVASVGANGTFSKDISLSTVGTHSITAKATDAFGNTSASSVALSISLVSGPAAPTGLDLATEDDNGTSNTDNITSQTNDLTFTGTAESGAKVELFDGTTSLGTTTAGSDGKFSMDIDLAIGTHAISAKAINSAGYSSLSSTALEIKIEAAEQSLLASLATDDGSSSLIDLTHLANTSTTLG